MKHAIIYQRQATTTPDNIMSQTQQCEQIAAQHDLQVVKTFTDNGISGLSQDRPALNAMFDFLEEQSEPYTVIATDTARVARGLGAFQAVYQRIQAANAELLTSQGRFNSSEKAA